MKPFKWSTPRRLAVGVLASLFCTLGTAQQMQNSDMQNQENALKAREQRQMGEMEHSAHGTPESEGKFRGVFYGYLPCHEQDCNGIKMTLSLNPKNKYLLVIQPAKPQNRESFEKGKYNWDDNQGVVTLTPNKEGAPPRRLSIKDDGTLLYISDDGTHLTEAQDRYLLKRSDLSDNRQMHIH